MSKSDIGWIDKDQISDTLRTLKRRQRPRRSNEPSAEDDTYVDLLGQTQSTAPDASTDDTESLLLPDTAQTSTAQTSTAQPQPTVPRTAPTPPAAPARTPVQHVASTTPTPPPAAAAPSSSTPARSTTPTAKLVTTPNALEDEPAQSTPSSGEPVIPGTRPSTDAPSQSPAQPRQTTTLETTPTRAQEADDADLSARFQDAFDVLRSADQHRLQDRHPTAEITPTSPAHRSSDDDLSLDAPTLPAAADAAASSSDLTLAHRETAPHAAAPARSEDLTLRDTSTPATSADTSARAHDDDALSLPGHDLDLSIHTSSPRVPSYDDGQDTQDLSGDLVFESEDFVDEQSNHKTQEIDAPLHIPDPEDDPHVHESTGQEPHADAPPKPEHAFVPKIHSQILKTVRLRTAPDPAQHESVYAWFKALHAWIQNAEAPATQFLVADHAGLSLLDTGVDPHTVAVAVATRKSMGDLREGDQKNAAGYTVFRHTSDCYMNLVWAPSPHGMLTLGIISDHVYPDERLAAFEEKLIRGLETLPFT